MAATLYLHNDARTLAADALREDLTHVFLGKITNIDLDTTLRDETIKLYSSDGTSRVKQPRFNPITTEYRTENNLNQDENRITNFYIGNSTVANKLILMDSTNVVRGIITFSAITTTEVISLYVPEIKINVL